MKKLIAALFAFVFLSGCASMNLSTTEKATIEILSRRIGNMITMTNPGMACSFDSFCRLYANAGVIDKDNMFEVAIKFLLANQDADPMLISDIKTLLEIMMADVDGDLMDIQEHKTAAMDAAFEGFHEGVKIAMKQNGIECGAETTIFTN